jgi:hypothetical protein
VCVFSEEKDDTLSAISGGSLKPELSLHATTSNAASIATPTLTATVTGNSVQTATPEIDDDEFSVKPPDSSWNKNGSPQKSWFQKIYDE